MERTVSGWIEELNAYGVRVGRLWVAWALGAPSRPYVGEYADVELDAEGYAVDVVVRAWRPATPSLN